MSELCLKDKTVLTFKDVEGVPSEIIKKDAPELLPVCLNENCTFDDVKKWLVERAISQNREGLKEVIERYGKEWLVNKNKASLSDHYWIKMRTERWGKINFFTNIYSKDIGDMFFTPWDFNKKKIDNVSPDLTLNGILKKRWKQDIKTKKSVLIKAGSRVACQDPLNEVLVSALIEKMETIECVHYDLTIEGSIMCSVCDNFIDENTELVPASYVYYQSKREDKNSILSHLLKMCEKNDIPNAEEYIKWLIYIDRITGNTDRTLGNIAFIRDINTMKFIGPAPVFDCGNAYWNTDNILGEVKSKKFGDVEDSIFKEMNSKIDVEKIFKKSDFSKLIYSYPLITDIKKQNMIDKIKECNNKLCVLNKI